MNSGADDTSRLADGFLQAAIDPAGWRDALQALAAATGSDRAQLIGMGPAFHVDFNWTNDPDGAIATAFDAQVANTPDVSYRVAAHVQGPSTGILFEDDYDRVIPGLATADYVDLCHDWGIPHGCQTDLLDGPAGLLGLALLRSARDGRTDAGVRDLFETASHGARAAALLQIALERQGHALISGAFEAMSAVCFVLDARLRVGAFTPAAQQLLSEDVVRLENARLTIADPAAARALARGYALLGDAPDAVPPPVRWGAFTLQLHRLPRRDWAFGFAPAAIATIRRPRPITPRDAELLRETFALTPTETEIVLLLHAGHSRARICHDRHITHETLRSHLRAVFGKTGARREADVVRLAGELLGG